MTMILYFSATGNSRYVAERIADAVNEKAISIEGLKPVIDLEENEMLGIVTPTYCYTIPVIVKRFLSRMKVNCTSDHYVFFVGTFGTSTGGAAAMANAIMKRKGFPIDAMFDIRMPDTWTPIFDLSNPEKVAERNRKADVEITEVIGMISDRVKGKHMDLSFPRQAAMVGEKYYDSARRTDHLSVSDACIGCGLCAERCPAKAIQLDGKKPVWVKKKCIMCLRCLHYCPKFAIQYGKNTARHGQYRNPHVKV